MTQARSGARTERAPASAATLACGTWPPRERRVRPAGPLHRSGCPRLSRKRSHSPQATAHRPGVISSVVEENSGSPRSFNDFRSSGGMRTLIYAATRAEDPQGTRSFHRRTTEPTRRSSALRLISFTQDEFLKL